MTPYSTGAPLYLQAGWAGVIPLPPGKKSAPPSGYTGWNGKDPSAKMIETWIGETRGEFQAASNIAIHMPDGVVGIDVDHYGDKVGGHTLAKLEAELGPLPATWKSSARPGISGIRWFRVEPGMRWPTGPGKDIEFIHVGHRYAVVWPSIHPNGAPYFWLDHMNHESEPPTEDELTEMPMEWQIRFTGGEVRTEQPEYRQATKEERAQCLTEGDMCKATSNALAEYQERTTVQARHDSMLKTTMALVRLGEQGHQGATSALKTLHGQFTAEVAPDRRDSSEESEFQRAVNGAIAKATAQPTPDDKRGCCGPSVNGSTADALPAPSDPMGVARVLIQDHQTPDGELTLRHWRGGWMQWQGTHWVEAEDKAIRSWIYGRLERAKYLHVQPATTTREEIRDLKPWNPNRHKIGDVLEALAAVAHSSETVDTPSWLASVRDRSADGPRWSAMDPAGQQPKTPSQKGVVRNGPQWSATKGEKYCATEIVACSNGLLHVGTSTDNNGLGPRTIADRHPRTVKTQPAVFQPSSSPVRL
jgi:hypothetical protein